MKTAALASWLWLQSLLRTSHFLLSHAPLNHLLMIWCVIWWNIVTQRTWRNLCEKEKLWNFLFKNILERFRFSISLISSECQRCFQSLTSGMVNSQSEWADHLCVSVTVCCLRPQAPVCLPAVSSVPLRRTFSCFLCPQWITPCVF